MPESSTPSYTPVSSVNGASESRIDDSDHIKPDDLQALDALDYLKPTTTKHPQLNRLEVFRLIILLGVVTSCTFGVLFMFLVACHVFASSYEKMAYFGILVGGMMAETLIAFVMVQIWKHGFDRLHKIVRLERRIMRVVNADPESAVDTASLEGLEDEVDSLLWGGWTPECTHESTLLEEGTQEGTRGN